MPLARAAALSLLGVALGACGVTVQPPGAATPEWMSRDEFRAYAEAVFRRHNAVVGELVFLLPELEARDPERYRALAAAEEQMLAACENLVEVASQRRRGLELGFFQRLHLPPEIAACDRETRRLEAMLAS